VSDYNLWKNDIKNRFPTGLIDENAIGDGYETNIIIGQTTTTSSWRMSLWDAYQDLRDKLLDGEVSILPKSTTAQRNALTGIADGTELLNIDTQRAEVCFNAGWISAGGSSSGSAVAFGAMYEDDAGGSSIVDASIYKGWISAIAGKFDSQGIASFANNASGDRIVIGAQGKGIYIVAFHISITNSGGNLTTAAIHINGVEQVSVKMSLTGDSAKAVHLASDGPLQLNANDYVDLRMKSSQLDILTIYQCNVNVDRIET